ncbi:MAG TPA: ATP-binding protein [Elusimicrobiales bacterium]|nr:ATP-binding protein [Elusimicrobiales bacterium]
MIISVASGKGGTGKTTVATALAQSMSTDVCLADCDVEEPNARFLLHPEISREENVFVKKPLLDEEKCTGCRQCVDVCQFNAISFIDNKPVFFDYLCHSCGGCILKCPENAISEKEVLIGKITFGKKENINFIEGSLNVGQAMSPPLIKEVIKQAKKYKDVIIDAPPGSSCPMVEAVSAGEHCFLVTEPTPFGLHDLQVAVEVLRTLKKSFSVIINRSDICDGKLKDFCKSENIPVAMEIPFSRKIAEGYSKGISMVAVEPNYKIKFKEIIERIKLCSK